MAKLTGKDKQYKNYKNKYVGKSEKPKFSYPTKTTKDAKKVKTEKILTMAIDQARELKQAAQVIDETEIDEVELDKMERFTGNVDDYTDEELEKIWEDEISK